ncbi:transposase [Nostoc sp. XA010]|nr:transposase [Nostoc sp. XA010]MCC5661249.1 transposase [Nostoc sp. XA010]
MSRKAYSTDITDADWEILQPLIPPAKTGGRTRTVDMREIINAMLYIQKSGYSWRLLPHDLPPWPTVYNYFRTWRRSGVWEKMNQALKRENSKFP